MKKKVISAALGLGYCVPVAFLAMFADVEYNAAWVYALLVVWLGGLCFGCIKMGKRVLAVAGNGLHFAASFAMVHLLQTERWGWYFKPFTAEGLVSAICLAAFVWQLIWVLRSRKK